MKIRPDAAACLLFAAAPLLVPGCKRAAVDPPTIELPEVKTAVLSVNPDNVLSVFFTCRTTNAEFVSVDVLRDSTLEYSTPTFMVASDSVSVPLVGLRPQTQYTLRMQLTSSSGGVRLHTSTLTTQALPPAITLPSFTLVRSDLPSVKNVLLGITPASGDKSYAVVIDRDAVPVWYKEFRDAVADFQKQPNGRYTAWSSTDGSPSIFHEFDVTGKITGGYRASGNLETGPHELRLVSTGHVLFGIEFRTMDLTAYGGLPNASVRGITVEWSRGTQPFRWSTFDHLSVTDAAPDIPLTTATVNPWHGNAIEIDTDGNLLVSFRNMDEITKINAQTGALIWRMGGRRNEFTFRGDPLNGFSHQHGVRRLPNGNIILFDNGNLHTPPQSRAVEYRIDETNKTADLVWEYRPSPPLYAFALGFAQRLANGNTLICFGTAQRIIEVDPAGRTRWEVTINDAQRYAYRAFALETLY